MGATDEQRPAQLDELVRQVRASPKYRAVSEELVRGIGARELAARRGLKEAVKATKNKLHQVAGAYLPERPRYGEWLAELERALADDRRPMADGRQPTTDHLSSGTEETPGMTESDSSSITHRRSSFFEACRRTMARHASTRERLPILEQLYGRSLDGLPPVRSVLDVACGLNPLAIPWMPLAPGFRYLACDIYDDMVEFLNRFFALAGVSGRAFVCDLVSAPPQDQVDLALVLKALPPLEQIDRGAGLRLLRRLDAAHILVSFPAQTLGGRDKGMAANYAERFTALVEAEGWTARRLDFATELAFLVRKSS